MMKLKTYRPWLMVLLMVIVVSGCERETQVKLPAHTPRLVVHAYVQTDSLFRVALGKTFAADVLLPEGDTYVTGAVLQLYENGSLKETLAYDAVAKRYYSISTRAAAGKTYRLVVSAPGFETAEATSIAPFLVSTQSAIIRRNVRTDENGNPLNDIIFKFADPASTTDYYLAEVNRPVTSNSGFCVYSYDPVIEKYQATLNPFSATNCISNKEVLFSDRSFNGQVKEITISADKTYTEETVNAITGDTLRPYLKRYCITADYFRFVKNIIALNEVNNDPFARPVANFTNVKNGYGLFTVYSAVTDTLR